MITKPKYLDVPSSNGELLPHVQKLEEDADIDAIIVRGAYGRLLPEERQELAVSIRGGYGNRHERNRDFAQKLIHMIVPDLKELTDYYRETANSVMPDFRHTSSDDLLEIDMVREPGDKSYAHIDLPIGIYARDGYEDIRAVSSLSIAAGVGSALFLAKRLQSFRYPDDLTHRFMMDYLDSNEVEEIEKAEYIKMDGWAMEQHPADIIIFPQFDRPAIHQVAPEAGRTAVVYSTFIRSHYEAYNNSPEGIAHPYLPRV